MIRRWDHLTFSCEMMGRGEESWERKVDKRSEMRWEACVSAYAEVLGPAVTTRLFFTVHRAADRETGWWASVSTALRWVTTSWGVRRIARGTSAPGAEGCKAMTKEGRAGAFATEAKEGGAGCAAGVGTGAVGGWARGLGVGWAGGFLAVAA